MNWDSYDTISDLISIRDNLLGLYDNISDSISVRDNLLGLYDKILDSINIREFLLGLYDKISDAQPEGQGHSISIREFLFTVLRACSALLTHSRLIYPVSHADYGSESASVYAHKKHP